MKNSYAEARRAPLRESNEEATRTNAIDEVDEHGRSKQNDYGLKFAFVHIDALHECNATCNIEIVGIQTMRQLRWFRMLAKLMNVSLPCCAHVCNVCMYVCMHACMHACMYVCNVM